jgi:hypothetical protein
MAGSWRLGAGTLFRSWRRVECRAGERRPSAIVESRVDVAGPPALLGLVPDCVVVVAVVLRRVLRASDAPLLREHWPGPGPERSLAAILRLAGVR